MCRPGNWCKLMTTSDLVFTLLFIQESPLLWSQVNTCFCVVEFQASVSLLNSPFKCNVIYFVGCIYRSLRELYTTLQCTVLLVSCWTRNTHTFAICRNERKLEHSTQFMTMNYDPKKYNQSSCVAL